MDDPIFLAEHIIKLGMSLYKMFQQLEVYKELADDLMFRVKQIIPALKVLKDMKDQKKELDDAQKTEPQFAAFTQSLQDMLGVVEDVQTFLLSLQNMNKFQQVRKRNKIEEEFVRLNKKLDILLGSIQLGILTDVKRDIESGKKETSVRILVKHVKSKSGAPMAVKGKISMVTLMSICWWSEIFLIALGRIHKNEQLLGTC